MSNKGNRFGIGPVEIADIPSRRARDPGPMGVAVREAATSAQDASEALVEQRRQNAADARAWREAHGEGRVLVRWILPLPADPSWVVPERFMASDGEASAARSENE